MHRPQTARKQQNGKVKNAVRVGGKIVCQCYTRWETNNMFKHISVRLSTIICIIQYRLQKTCFNLLIQTLLLSIKLN